jgi:DNA replication protein DnaC
VSASAQAPELLRRRPLKRPKPPTMLREHEKRARRCASEGVDHVRHPARPIEPEPLDREARTVERRIEAAKLPAVKSPESPESPDFDAIPSLDTRLVLDLARGGFVARRENVIALGPSGTGKTHAAIGLGLAACQRGIKTRLAAAAASPPPPSSSSSSSSSSSCTR